MIYILDLLSVKGVEFTEACSLKFMIWGALMRTFSHSCAESLKLYLEYKTFLKEMTITANFVILLAVINWTAVQCPFSISPIQLPKYNLIIFLPKDVDDAGL